MARIRSLGRAPLYLVLVTGLLASTVWLNTELRELREGEVNTSLRAVRLETVSDQNLFMLGRMDLLLERFAENHASADQLYVEARLEKMLQNTKNEPESGPKNTFALVVVNAARNLLGKAPLRVEQSSASQRRLEEAYLRERLRRFRDAELIYRELLQIEEDPYLRPPLELHLAFCVLMQGRLQEAISLLEKLERENPGTEEATVGSRLRGAARRFLLLRQRPVEGSVAARAREHVRRLEFDKARELAQQTLAGSASLEDKVSALRVLAEIAEQSGEYAAAEASLEQLLLLDPDGPGSQEARRRLVFLHRVLLPRPEKAAAQEEILVRNGDDSFVAALRSLSRQQEAPSPSSESPVSWFVLVSEPLPGRVYHNGVFLGMTPLVIDVGAHPGPFVIQWERESQEVFGPFVPGERRLVSRPPRLEAAVVSLSLPAPPPVKEIEEDGLAAISAIFVEPPAPVTVASRHEESLVRYLDRGYWIRSPWLANFEEIRKALSPEIVQELESRRRSRQLEEETLRTALAELTLREKADSVQESRFWQGGVGLGSGALLLGIMAWSIYSGNQLYQVYQSTENESVAELRLPLTLYSTLSWTAGILGGAGVLGGGWLLWEDFREAGALEEVRKRKLRLESELSAREPPRDFP